MKFLYVIRPVTRRENGVALVITLLMLVVITTMAVAFLLLSQRETASVSALHSTTDAELATEAGHERAKAEILRPFLPDPANPMDWNRATNEVMGPDFTVSTTNGFVGRLEDAAPNVIVNYSGLITNSFLDLNRNGMFEPTGFVDDLGNPAPPGNQGVEWRVGDPMWLAILQDPKRPFGRDNYCIARYCFLIQPAGRTLDVNWIHNDVRPANVNQWLALNQASGYYRNQGVGTWELNQAGFFADLNASQWGPGALLPYRYDPYVPVAAIPASGFAFDDAMEFLRYRYADTPTTLRNGIQLFGPSATNFSGDSVDNYGDGPIVAFNTILVESQTMPAADNAAIPWPGAASPKNFFTPHDFFDSAKLPGPGGNQLGFRDRLRNASAPANRNSYDRYTFYRMLSQLGTDSAPEKDDKLNINYKNTDGLKASQFTNWMAIDFFTNAVDRLLTNEFYPLGITWIGLGTNGPPAGTNNPPLPPGPRIIPRSIPVYLNGSAFTANGIPLYSPRIHQLIQIAANIYEATVTNKVGEDYPYLPSVFRPVFRRRGNEIHIANYVDETGANFSVRALPPSGGGQPQLKWWEFREFLAAGGAPTLDDNFYDIPIIFGARKGIPTLNEINMYTSVQVTRRLQIEKPSRGPVTGLRHSFIVGVSNIFSAECWNSLTNSPYAASAYPRRLDGVFINQPRCWLTNDAPLTNFSVSLIQTNFVKDTLTWQGGGYVLAPTSEQIVLSNSVFFVDAPGPRLERLIDTNRFDTSTAPFAYKWGLILSNRFMYFLFDNVRVVDAFSSARMTSTLDITRQLQALASESQALAVQKLWNNKVSAYTIGGNMVNFPMTEGDYYQLLISRAETPIGDAWNDYAGLLSVSSVGVETRGFREWMDSATNDLPYRDTPFNSGLKMVQATTWQVNDPFVHYTVYDLYPTNKIKQFAFTPRPSAGKFPFSVTNDNFDGVRSPGYQNQQYKPWGSADPSNGNQDDYNYAEKDPGVYSPSLWEFPTHKLPNVGWLGRIHRGTPWQTIYLKSAVPGYDYAAGWTNHVGAAYMPETVPMRDWELLDLFTTSIAPSLNRGQMSMNQTNLAAWSAVFSGIGVTVITNDGGSEYYPHDEVIQPAAVESATNSMNPIIQNIVRGITIARTNLPGPFGANFAAESKQFRRLGEFLAAPELTIASPFMRPELGPSVRQTYHFNATDSDYERIPQEILGLVKVGEPRFVVYAWGQSLKPAGNVQGVGFGIDASTKVPRNYQVTGEMATRAVVRIEYEKDSNGQPDHRRPRAVVESFNILPTD